MGVVLRGHWSYTRRRESWNVGIPRGIKPKREFPEAFKQQ